MRKKSELRRMGEAGDAVMVDMKVSRLMVDPFTNLPVLILEDERGLEAIPVGIGLGEAPAIATELSKVELDRPLAHDLMKSILGRCGARVESVELRDLRKDTYYASIVLLLAGGGRAEIDARPSDAIALALRTQARIRVARKVIDKAQRRGARGGRRHLVLIPSDHEASGEPQSALGDSWLLEALRDEDFGKWKM